MPDVNDEDFALPLIDLVQHAPIRMRRALQVPSSGACSGFPSRFGLPISGPVMKSTAAAATSGGSLLVIARRAGGARAIS